MACLIWGVMPIYFKLLQDVAPIEVVAHRIIWSVPLLLIILYFRKNLAGLLQSWAQTKVRIALIASAALITANWLIYVWAVHQDHVLAASLGYFIGPLLSVFMGRVFLKEKLRRNQWIAVGIAAIGVAFLAAEAWQTLWISMALAASWSSYALVRKIAVVGPIVGLTIETSLLFPIFLLFLLWLSFGTSPPAISYDLGSSLRLDLLLIGGAIVTAAPLTLFAAAVKKMTFSAIGLLQYLAPIMQFLIGVFIYNEPLSTSHLICFTLIWISLALFSVDSFLTERKTARLKAI